MVAVVTTVTVPFAGEGSGTAELAWGQTENWTAIVAQKTWIPLGGIKPLPAGTTVADITAELAYLMGRYQTMRTKLTFDGDGTPTQIVSASGHIDLEVIDAGEDDPAAVADATAERYRDRDMDFTREWPVRMGVVTRGESATHMVVFVSHFVTDAAGAAVMLAEVAARTAEPVTGAQPLAQVQWQRSPAGQRQNAAAQRYWETLLREIDPVRFPPPAERATPRWWLGEFRSRALAVALRAIVDRTGMESSPVLIAMYAIALQRVTGANPVVFRPMVSNRFRPGMGDAVATIAQAGLCALDIAGVPFAQALERARKAAMSAYKYGYFEPMAMRGVVARVEAERAVRFDLSSFFNDRRAAGRLAAPMAAPDAAEALRTESTFGWLARQDAPSFERLFVHVEDVADPMVLTIQMDAHALTPADGERLLRTMEAVAVDQMDI